MELTLVDEWKIDLPKRGETEKVNKND